MFIRNVGEFLPDYVVTSQEIALFTAALWDPPTLIYFEFELYVEQEFAAEEPGALAGGWMNWFSRSTSFPPVISHSTGCSIFINHPITDAI
jgi:hypothetical protein